MNVEKLARKNNKQSTQCVFCAQQFTSQGIRMHERVCKANNKASSQKYRQTSSNARGTFGVFGFFFSKYVGWLEACWSGLWSANFVMATINFVMLIFSIALPVWLLSQINFIFWGVTGMLSRLVTGTWSVVTFFVDLSSDFSIAKQAIL
jgi:hypothetical protein